MSLKDFSILPTVFLQNLFNTDNNRKNLQNGGATGEETEIRKKIKEKMENNQRKSVSTMDSVPVWIETIEANSQLEDLNKFERSVVGKCLKFNQGFINSDLYENSEIANHFVECVLETDWIEEETKLILSTRLCLFLLLIICSSSDQEFKKDCFNVLTDLLKTTEHRQDAFLFLKIYREEVFKNLRDPELSFLCLEQLLQFIRKIAELIVISNMERRVKMVKQIQPPVYLNPVVKNRLTLLLLLPNSLRFHSVFKSYYLIRGERCLKGWMDVKNNKLKGEDWAELLNSCELPSLQKTDLKLTSGGTHRMFLQQVWGVGLEKKNKKLTNKESKKLLFQMFTFLMPNWEYLWVFLGFERNFEIQRRLYYLKKINWEPNVDQLLKLLFVLP